MIFFADGDKIGQAIDQALIESLDKASHLSQEIEVAVKSLKELAEEEFCTVYIAAGDNFLAETPTKKVAKILEYYVTKLFKDLNLSVSVGYGETLKEARNNFELSKKKNHEKLDCLSPG